MMQLGIIAAPTEESFQRAKQKGLDFIEVCVNEGQDVDAFYQNRGNLLKWKNEYGVSIESIGRWKSLRIDEKGSVIEEELERCYRLIDVASELGCTNFVSGCNYVEELSFYENCTAAITFFHCLLTTLNQKG